jgi:MFS family permease
MAAAFFASIAVAANQFKVPPVMQTLMAELQVGMVTGGWLMSVFAVAGILLSIPAAWLLSRWGLKATGAVALGCTVAGSLLGGMATSASVLLLGRLIEGIAIGLIGVVAPAAISAWFEPRERGLPMGIWAAWVPVGNVIMFNIAHPLQAAFGWRAVWWFGAALAAVALVVYLLVVGPPPGARDQQAPGVAAFAAALRNPTAWLLGFCFATLSFCLIAYNTWAPAYLTETLGVPPPAASFYASLIFLAGIAGNVAAGWAINRTGRGNAVLLVAFVLSTLAFAPSFSLAQVAWVAPYMLGLGFLTNFIPTSTFTLAPETMPRRELAGLALALVSVGSNAGVLVGPPVIGALVSGGNWALGSLCFVAVMALGSAAAVLVWRRMAGART